MSLSEFIADVKAFKDIVYIEYKNINGGRGLEEQLNLHQLPQN